ncbi:MAG: hypothetical protein ACQKBT_07785, partial [Puniceicoccales bacterium]
YYSMKDGAGVFEIMLSIGAYLAIPLAVPTLLGLFFKKVPSWTAIVSAMTALGASLFAGFSHKFGLPEMNFQTTIFFVFAVGSAAFFLCGFWWSKAAESYKQRVNEFFKTMHTPVDFEKEIGGANDNRQLLVLGKMAVLVAVLILCLTVVPEKGYEKAQIVFVALFLGSIGTFMWILGRRSQKELERDAKS